MYRINPLPRQVLITTDEVIALAPTDNSVDPRNILQAISIAEDRFVRQAICKNLYNDFRSLKNVIVTDINKSFLQDLFPTGVTLNDGDMVNAIELVSNSNYQTFWYEHLWKMVAECVLYIATPTNFSRYTAEGEMINNPKTIGMDGQGSASATLKELQWKMDKMMMDRIDPIIASAQEYLCDNVTLFPFYDCRKCCNEDGVSYKRKTAWIHGVYEHRRRRDGIDGQYGQYGEDFYNNSLCENCYDDR